MRRKGGGCRFDEINVIGKTGLSKQHRLGSDAAEPPFDTQPAILHTFTCMYHKVAFAFVWKTPFVTSEPFCIKMTIMKTCLYYFDPLKLQFYIVKPGFTGICIFFFFLLINIDSPRFEQKYEKYIRIFIRILCFLW